MIPIAKPYITKDEAQAAYEVILSGWITQGPRVQKFEELFAAYVGSRYAVAVSSCTTALHLAMIVAGVGKGDEVICPSMSYIATANSIIYVGATPVFAEIDPNNYNLDPEDVKRRITKRTKAILLVHQIGMPANIELFRSIATENGLILIEDAACAIGSVYKGQRIGFHSDLVCFSFHPRKVISTGDGGMISTSDTGYYERLKILRQHGMSVNDRVRHESKSIIFEDHLEIGYNYRMTDIQAAVGIEQLKKLDWIINERRRIAKYYLDNLKDIPCLELPFEDEGYISNYQSFSIRLKDSCPVSRNELMENLLKLNISTRRGIMTSHRSTAYTNIFGKLRLPVSEKTSDTSIIIPLYVPMEEADMRSVVEAIKKCMISHT